jgi:hypothetical protein
MNTVPINPRLYLKLRRLESRKAGTIDILDELEAVRPTFTFHEE